jgi:ribA/ribD-fused uncharacterized protein
MINRFREDYFFLSNFYPCTVLFEGLTYPSSENVYQAYKTLDEKERLKFLTMTASEAKKAASQIALRPDWEDIKKELMAKIVTAKFAQNPELEEMLLNTGDELIVDSNDWHDNIWGQCSCEECKAIKGENILGVILMQIRDEIKNR